MPNIEAPLIKTKLRQSMLANPPPLGQTADLGGTPPGQGGSHPAKIRTLRLAAFLDLFPLHRVPPPTPFPVETTNPSPTPPALPLSQWLIARGRLNLSLLEDVPPSAHIQSPTHLHPCPFQPSQNHLPSPVPHASKPTYPLTHPAKRLKSTLSATPGPTDLPGTLHRTSDPGSHAHPTTSIFQFAAPSPTRR